MLMVLWIIHLQELTKNDKIVKNQGQTGKLWLQGWFVQDIPEITCSQKNIFFLKIIKLQPKKKIDNINLCLD